MRANALEAVFVQMALGNAFGARQRVMAGGGFGQHLGADV